MPHAMHPNQQSYGEQLNAALIPGANQTPPAQQQYNPYAYVYSQHEGLQARLSAVTGGDFLHTAPAAQAVNTYPQVFPHAT
eukprot:765539-Hanusia_phi.AAC.5